MALLDIKNRQKYLKTLGFYEGAIDGTEGPKTKAAYLALQKHYFTRPKDKDGLYGQNTDILLRNAYNVKTKTKNFSLYEFKCKCGGTYCTGQPAVLDTDLLANLQKIRDIYGQPITIASGLRCPTWNKSRGGASGSRHKSGKAADIYMSGITTTEAGRKKVMAQWKKLPQQRYTYCNIGGSHPNMGNSVHVDVL